MTTTEAVWIAFCVTGLITQVSDYNKRGMLDSKGRFVDWAFMTGFCIALLLLIRSVLEAK